MAVMDPVRFYAPDHPALAVKLRAQLDVHRKELLENILYVRSWEAFCELRGGIQELDIVREMALNVEKELNERKP